MHAVQSPEANLTKSTVSGTPKKSIGKGNERNLYREGYRKGRSANDARGDRGRGKVTGKGPPVDGPDKVSRGLAYQGILERPQRYDPGRELRKSNGAVPNPEARELQVDHFQELDRNQDGVLDPMERAVGRLDIERDMRNR